MTNNTLSPHEDPTHQDAQLAAELKAATQGSGLQSSQRLGQGLSNSLQDNGHVDISTEKRPSRERRILASVTIPKPIDQVWNVVTDYEHLADFVPNLTSSKLIPNEEGRIRLEQIGAQCFLKFKFCARVVLDMTETFPNEVSFAMKEGDFKHFVGAWKLESAGDNQSTQLSYDLFVKPPLAMPAALIEHHICNNLAANMLAIRTRAIEIAAA
ncbi:MAG: SRPBCC family protein [Cyanobacteria bacterium P01_F01_bin.86]